MSQPRPRCLLVVAAFASGACVETAIIGKPSESDAPVDTDPVFQPPAPIDTAPPEVLPTCDGVQASFGAWRAGGVFTEEADPIDGNGLPFHAVDFDEAGWSGVVLPDRDGIPAGHDRAYRAELQIQGEAPRWLLDLQSDDGLSLWIDGSLLGRWGGGWQEEGCVNDDADCLETNVEAPLDVTAVLPPGTHSIAARVSNPIEGSYLDLQIRCETTP